MLSQRKFLIDDLRMDLLPKELPSVSDGQKFLGKDFGSLPIVSRAFSGSGHPTVEIGAVVQCAPGRFGAMCQVRCNANEKFDCKADGKKGRQDLMIEKGHLQYFP